MSDSSLTAFYDLEVSPVSFDFAVFLVLAENFRKRLDCKTLRIVIVPGANSGFRNENSGYDIDNKKWRLQNILIPITHLLKDNVALYVCGNRSEARDIFCGIDDPVFPEGYTINEPVSEFFLSSAIAAVTRGEKLPSLKAPSQAQKYMRNWLQSNTNNRKAITITLRESTYNVTRNSNIQSWLEFARDLNTENYLPIFIRDTEKCFDLYDLQFEGFLCCNIASVNLPLRMALYEESWLNLMVPNGPGELCRFSNTIRYLYFNVINETADSTSKLVIASQGIELGGQLPFSSSFQKMIWEPDEVTVIKREFDQMAQQINSTKKNGVNKKSNKEERKPIETAVQLQMTGRAEDAVTIYQDILQKDPENADAWHFLGIIAHQSGQLEMAEKMILRAVSLRRDNANIFVSAARIERDLGKTAEAKSALISAITIDPNDAGAHADLAKILHETNKIEEAKNSMMRALQLAPETPEYYEQAASMLQENGDIAEAVSLYRKAIDVRESNLKSDQNQKQHMSEIPRVTLGFT